MGKIEELELVAEMVDLEPEYVIKEASYFSSKEKAFHWIFLSEENPVKPYSKEQLIEVMASITVEDMQDLKANSVIEYMLLDDVHTYITKSGVAYLRIQR